MNGTAWNLDHSYERRWRFWLYLSLVLLAVGLLLSFAPDNRFVHLASHVALITAIGSILVWVSYALDHPHPWLIMTLTLVAEAIAFWFGAAQSILQHALSNFVWG